MCSAAFFGHFIDYQQQISENQLTQYKGEKYDQVNKMIQEAEDAATAAEEDDDSRMSDSLTRHKTYLERVRKQIKIVDRARDISKDLTDKLQDRSTTEVPQFFHISAAEYMKWIKREKLIFRDQPDLPPEMTGIPSVRRYLYDLPAQRNLTAYNFHMNIVVPAFIEKLKRVVTESDRDADFRTIADDFDRLRTSFMGHLLVQTRSSFRSFSKTSINVIRAHTRAARQQVDHKIRKKWFLIKGQAFTKVLKARGNVPPGTSRAKELEQGCQWNMDLAQTMAPAFQKWYESHIEAMRVLREALVPALDQLYQRTLKLFHDSTANLVIVDRAKVKWEPMRYRLRVKMIALMDKVVEIDERFLHRATMEDERENNIISAMTGPMYDEIYHAAPELRAPSKKSKQKYVTPKIAFQKSMMDRMFLHSDNHFVDELTAKFQELLDARIDGLVTAQFEEMNSLLDDFSTSLREQAPVNYHVNPVGKKIRDDLRQLIPSIEEKAAELQGQLPKLIKNEKEQEIVEVYDDPQASNEGLEFFITKANKRKKTDERGPKKREADSATKKAKRETS